MGTTPVNGDVTSTMKRRAQPFGNTARLLPLRVRKRVAHYGPRRPVAVGDNRTLPATGFGPTYVDRDDGSSNPPNRGKLN